MRFLVPLLFLLGLSGGPHVQAKNKWFHLYKDSTALVADASQLLNQVSDRVAAIRPNIVLKQNRAIKNTSPYLIYIDFEKQTINLPFWSEVMTPHKNFFFEVAGGEKQGEEVFGLFFNGFYLAHEIGHSFFSKAGKTYVNPFDSEYDANVFAILFWRANGQTEELKKCYSYARIMLSKLKNPVPPGEDPKKYLTENYDRLASDPYQYGYIQFSQFVEIYEQTQLPDFDAFVRQ